MEVTNYTTLIYVLTSNFEEVFPNYPTTDPQNMIEFMKAEIENLRHRLEND